MIGRGAGFSQFQNDAIPPLDLRPKTSQWLNPQAFGGFAWPALIIYHSVKKIRMATKLRIPKKCQMIKSSSMLVTLE